MTSPAAFSLSASQLRDALLKPTTWAKPPKPPPGAKSGGGGPDSVLRAAIRQFENRRFVSGALAAGLSSRTYLNSSLSSNYYQPGQRGASLAATVRACFESYVVLVGDDPRTVVSPDPEHKHVFMDGMRVGTGVDFVVADIEHDRLFGRIVVWASTGLALLEDPIVLAQFACPAALAVKDTLIEQLEGVEVLVLPARAWVTVTAAAARQQKDAVVRLLREVEKRSA